MTYIIHCKKVSFGFNPQAFVINNVDLAVKAGERVALMGASGTGKTCLLKVIGGIQGYLPISGDVVIGGRFAMVFQQPLLLNHLCVKDNILLPSRIQHRDNLCIDEIVRILGLFHLLDRFPYQLSGGQQRRVAIARALAYPDIQGVIMDEPFTGLDEPLRDQIMTDLQVALDSTGLTCLFTTHSPEEAVFLADRIVFLGGRPATVYAEHSVDIDNKHVNMFDDPKFSSEASVVRSYLKNSSNFS